MEWMGNTARKWALGPTKSVPTIKCPSSAVILTVCRKITSTGVTGYPLLKGATLNWATVSGTTIYQSHTRWHTYVNTPYTTQYHFLPLTCLSVASCSATTWFKIILRNSTSPSVWPQCRLANWISSSITSGYVLPVSPSELQFSAGKLHPSAKLFPFFFLN